MTGPQSFEGANDIGLMQDATEVMPAAPPESCRCPEHKYGHRPGCDAVLYAGLDAVLLMINSAIRDGRYEDVGAYADEAQHSIHASLDATGRRARLALEPAILAWQRADEARKGMAA